jgi:hypothetical protein
MAALLAAVALVLIAPASPALGSKATERASATGTESSAWVVQKIRSKYSRLCLVARGGPGSRIEQTPCANFPDQDWEVRPIASGSQVRQYRNVHSGLCLLARGSSESWATVDVCNKQYSDQLWTLETWGGVDYKRVINYNSGLCLAARGTSPAIQTLCGVFDDQFWFPW